MRGPASAGCRPFATRYFGTRAEMLGRVRAEDGNIRLPAAIALPGGDGAVTINGAIERYVCDDDEVPTVLNGDLPDEHRRGPRDPELQTTVVRVAEAACSAAGQVTKADTLLRTRNGALPARDYLLRLTVSRSLLAHYVAAYLGSTACPLPEELARPLWELTASDAAAWRRRGVFRDPLPIPEHAS